MHKFLEKNGLSRVYCHIPGIFHENYFLLNKPKTKLLLKIDVIFIEFMEINANPTSYLQDQYLQFWLFKIFFMHAKIFNITFVYSRSWAFTKLAWIWFI